MTPEREDLVSTRLGKFYFVDWLAAGNETLRDHLQSKSVSRGMHAHMFIEDSCHLLPWGDGLDEGFTAELLGASSETAEKYIEAMPSQYGPATSLEEAVRGFCDTTAPALMDGPLVYEIDVLVEPDSDQRKPIALSLEYLDARELGNSAAGPIQYVPEEVEHDGIHLGMPFVQLDQSRLIRIELPAVERALINRAFEVFQALDANQGFPLALMEQGETSRIGFDFSRFRRAQAEVALRATTGIGWSGRALLTDGMLDTYSAWRHLNFLRFKCRLRDVILASLAEVFRRLGEPFGEQPTFRVAGLTSITDLDAAEARLMRGESSCREIFELQL